MLTDAATFAKTLRSARLLEAEQLEAFAAASSSRASSNRAPWPANSSGATG